MTFRVRNLWNKWRYGDGSYVVQLSYDPCLREQTIEADSPLDALRVAVENFPPDFSLPSNRGRIWGVYVGRVTTAQRGDLYYVVSDRVKKGAVEDWILSLRKRHNVPPKLADNLISAFSSLLDDGDHDNNEGTGDAV